MRFEQTPAPEDEREVPSERELFETVLATHAKESEIIRDIEKVFEITPDKAEAERIVLKRYAMALDEALRRSRQALEQWWTTIE